MRHSTIWPTTGVCLVLATFVPGCGGLATVGDGGPWEAGGPDGDADVDVDGDTDVDGDDDLDGDVDVDCDSDGDGDRRSECDAEPRDPRDDDLPPHVPDIPEDFVDAYEACDGASCEGANLISAGGGLGFDCIEGSPLGAAFRVANCGTDTIPTEVQVSLRFDGEEVDSGVVPAGMGPGKAYWLGYEVSWEVWVAHSGDPIEIAVDPTDEVHECRETDNTEEWGDVRPACIAGVTRSSKLEARSSKLEARSSKLEARSSKLECAVGAGEPGRRSIEADSPAATLVIESRGEIATTICDEVTAEGVRAVTACCMEEVASLARAHHPSAVVAHIGFEQRSGLVATLAARGYAPDALMLVYCEPCDAALLPAATRVGLGSFLVSSAPLQWVPRLLPNLCRAARLLALHRRERVAFEPADSLAFSGMLDLGGLLVDVEVALIRAALSHSSTTRGAARVLRMHERTLRGRIAKLGIRRRSQEAAHR